MQVDRRGFLRLSTGGVVLGATSGAGLLTGCQLPILPTYGTLLTADANGLRLPPGFTSRVVATSGQTVPNTSHVWHNDPDGGACFATPGGGWIYASNSESTSPNGGVGVIRFAADGTILSAAKVLTNTGRNCAGGATPWGTWLSCEETSTGQVYECDPTGVNPSAARPLMGRFNHEAATCDVKRACVYLSEDSSTGCLYRFVPTTWGDLSAGTLQVLTEVSGVRSWQNVPDPDGSPTATRSQVAGSIVFNGGEGMSLIGDYLFLATKGDNRVWRIDVVTLETSVLYDDNTSANPILTGVDNVTALGPLMLFVAEDGGNMEIVRVTMSGDTQTVVQITGVSGSEVTGPAFSPNGSRLYFSSQRNPGRTYEVTGPWKTGSPA